MATSQEFGDQVVANASDYAAQEFSQGTESGVGSMPWWAQASEDAPGIGTSILAAGWRGSNTIVGGGWNERNTAQNSFRRHRTITFGGRRPGREIDTSTFRGQVRASAYYNNPFRSRNWGRFGSQDIFHGDINKSYSPFQAAARAGNWGARKIAGDGALGAALRAEGGGNFVERGMIARLSAAGRVENMSSRAFAGSQRNVANMLLGNDLSPQHVGAIRNLNQAGMASALRMQAGAVGGFVQGAQRANNLGDLAAGTKSGLYTRSASVGAEAAMRWTGELAGKGVNYSGRGVSGAMRFVGSSAVKGGMAGAGKATAIAAGRFAATRVATYGIPVLGQALLVKDLIKLTAGLVGNMAKGTVRIAADAFKSYSGNFSTGPMQGGFRDNDVARTTRQRGVMAIANSQLNARSVLGSEAGVMASHFG